MKRAYTPAASADIVFPQSLTLDLYAGVTLIGPYEAKGQDYPTQAILRLGATMHVRRFGFSLGYASIQHDDWINSGRNNFHLGVSYELRPNLLLRIDHVSNGGSSAPNKGRDLISLAKVFH